MTDAAATLERRYRRWLRCYPAWYRREHEDEVLGVLVTGAPEASSRPDPAECWCLVRGAVVVRLRPRIARSQRWAWAALRLIRLAAVVQLAVGITVLTAMGRLRSALAADDPGYTAAQWHLEATGVVYPLAIECGIGFVALLALAWMQGRSRRGVRLLASAGLVVLLVITADSLGTGLRHGSASDARADVAVGSLLWLVELAAFVAALRADVRPGMRHHGRRSG